MSSEAVPLPAASTASPIKLYYWGMHGRAGAAFRMLAEAGVAYEHVMAFPEIAARSAAFGAATENFAPPLVVDGDTVISQSLAVAHYIGNKYGFGVPAGQESKAIMLGNQLVDLFENGVAQKSKGDSKAFKEYFEGADGKPARFVLMATSLERAVKGTFFFGEKPSWVDFFLAGLYAFYEGSVLATLTEISGRDYFEVVPKLKGIAHSIISLESAAKIAAPIITDSFKVAKDAAVFTEFATEK